MSWKAKLMIHQAGLVQIQISHSFNAKFTHQLFCASHFSSTLTERQRECLESQADILNFHTPTQWCGTHFNISQSKALPKKCFAKMFPSHTGIKISTAEHRGSKYFNSADLKTEWRKMREVKETNSFFNVIP